MLNEHVGRTVESVDHAPNVLQIVARNSTGVEECRFVAPDDVTQCEPHVGQCNVANLVNFWRVSEKREAESCDGVAEANAEVYVAHVDGPFVGSSCVPLEKYRCNGG